MASTATYIAEWFRHHLSSVVTFQKQFVDDVSETVKEQKAQFDRHTREANERAVQLHLDKLEEKYLCCVCGRGGEIREDDEFVYDTYSMVTLPPRGTLEAAVREELADVELSDERMKQHQRMLTTRQRRTSVSSATATYDSDNDSDSASEVSGAPSGRRSEKSAKERQRRKKRAKAPSQRHAAQRSRRQREEAEDSDSDGQDTRHGDGATAKPAAVQPPPASVPSPRTASPRRGPLEIHTTDLAVMDPDMVGPLDVRNTLYKIRHAVLHKEARVRRKSVAVHRDKGLMTIEESEIEMFSHFFQRPVHGYLCMACYTCARRRLDTLTQQIRAILFKAEHPVLRRVPAKELEALTTGNQVPATLIQSILTVQRRWAAFTEEQHTELHGSDGQGERDAVHAEERARGAVQPPEKVTTLSEKSILILREEVRCGACQRRSACYFEPKSVVFLCQFCTARDRFYREHAVCINDEPMPLMQAHLLQDLALYYQGVHQQMELRQAPLSAIAEAQTDLFPLTEIMRDREGLFACQAPAAVHVTAPAGHGTATEQPATHSSGGAVSGDGGGTSVLQEGEMSLAGPSTSAAATRKPGGSPVPAAEQRERVGRSMVSLFDGVKVEGTGVNLFRAPAAPTAAPAAQAAAPSQPLSSPINGTTFASDGGYTAAGAQGNGSPMVPPVHAAVPAATTHDPDWDSLF